MDDTWRNKLHCFSEAHKQTGIRKMIHTVGSKGSAMSTVYGLRKKFPKFIFSHEENNVLVTIPEAEPLLELALSKWKMGSRERGLSEDFPPTMRGFVGSTYAECREELADLYNYIQVAAMQFDITESQREDITQRIQALYNITRESFEENNV